MKKITEKLLLICILSMLIGCSSNTCYISLSSSYTGWIYVIKSSDSIKGDTYYPDSKGVVYLPSTLYLKAKILLTIDGNLPKKTPYKVYKKDFYPEDNKKISYTTFYFPFTNRVVEEKLYEHNNRSLTAFEYLFYTGAIEHSRIKRE